MTAAPVTEAASACLLCGGEMHRLFEARDYRRPRLAQTFRVVWCAPCGYGRVAARLSPPEVAAFYRVDYYTHAEAGDSGAPAARRLLGRLRTHLAWRFDRGADFAPQELGPPGRIIDIGCGAGPNMARLKAAGFEVVGVEPDPAARDVARQYGPVHEGTAEDPPAEAGTGFDYALMSHVLEHTINPATALQRAHGLLRPGGRLVVEVPNCAAPGFGQFGPSWPWTDLPRHLHYFTRGSLTAMLSAAGFRPAGLYYTGFTRQFDPTWIRAIDAIHDELQCTDDHSTALGRQSWGLLLRSVWAAADRKYDSVRLHAVRA